MAINRKIILLSLLFLIPGAFVSYRAFYINGKEYLKLSEKAGQEVTGWAARNIEQKLLQLEASVSYLDPSTVESMKRLGARYFAYVYKKQGEWSVKWKKLGFFEREKILTEVGEIDFDKITSEKRTWHFNHNGEAVYVTPATLARSHQLQEGFLIFGLKKDFFKFIQSEKSRVILLTEKHEALEGGFPPELEDKKENIHQDRPGMINIRVKRKRERLIFTSYFSPLSQLWIIEKRSFSTLSYFRSLFFYYFLISVCLGFLLLLLFGGKFIFPLPVVGKSSENKIPGENEKSFNVNENTCEISIEEKNDDESPGDEKIPIQVQSPEQLPPSSESPGREKSTTDPKNQEELKTEKPVKGEKESLIENKKDQEPLSEVEKRVEEALCDFQLENFAFELSVNDRPDPASKPDRQERPKTVKTGIETDEQGLFEFDNGQFKIKIRPPKKRDENVNH